MNEKAFYAQVVQMIDVSSRRGSWEGPELKIVSDMREHAVAKLQSMNESVVKNVYKLPDNGKDKDKE